MSGRTRRGGQLVDASGRSVTWSVAEGRRGRRWRWTITDRSGAAMVAHTLETDPGGQFQRLESATGRSLLTLHRETDGSIHGNRITDVGIDHLVVPAPAPKRVLVGSAPIGISALVAGAAPAAGSLPLDIVEVLDDLGIRVIACVIGRDRAGIWEVRTGTQVRRQLFDEDGLPADEAGGGRSWPLEGE